MLVLFACVFVCWCVYVCVRARSCKLYEVSGVLVYLRVCVYAGVHMCVSSRAPSAGQNSRTTCLCSSRIVNLVQGGEDSQVALSFQVIFRKRAL